MRIEISLAPSAIDTLDRLLSCREGVSVLLLPDAQLGERDRDRLGSLLELLDDLEAAALQALRKRPECA